MVRPHPIMRHASGIVTATGSGRWSGMAATGPAVPLDGRAGWPFSSLAFVFAFYFGVQFVF